MNSETLFAEPLLSSHLQSYRSRLSGWVDEIPQDQFMNSSQEIISEHLIAKCMLSPLVIHEDRRELESHETQIDISNNPNRQIWDRSRPFLIHAHEIEVSIPYDGDPVFWKYTPNQYQGNFPRGNINSKSIRGQNQLVITVIQPGDEPMESVKPKFDAELAAIRFYIAAQFQQISQFNNEIRTAIQELVRRERITKAGTLSEMLGIPMRRNENSPIFAPIKLAEKLIRPLPPAPKSGYTAEPGITDEDFQYILKILRHVTRTFETTPKTYSIHDEEELRDIILANLNGHFNGGANGECFRRNGKTDICIEDQRRNAFIAECKIWTGESEIAKAIDQLLGYLTWRDCKASIIIFNKHNSGFTRILEKAPQAFISHEKFQSQALCQENGEWEFVMRSKEDESRCVIIRVFAVNIYSERS